MSTICINNGTTVHDQGNEGICYATSSATHIRNQIIRRNGKPISHQQIVKIQRKYMMEKYGNDQGAFDYQMKEFIEYILRKLDADYNVGYISVQDTSKALSSGKSPIICLTMTNNQLKQFLHHLQNSPQLPFDLKSQSQNDKSGTIGHSCVIVGQTEEYWKIKNSWGKGSGDKGYFRLYKKSFNSILLNGQSMCRIMSTTPLNPTTTEELLKKYSQTNKNDICYQGGIKIGGKLDQNHTFMYAKDQKNNINVSQQQDLVKLEHKNINKIQSIHYDGSKDRHVIISEYYDQNLTTRQTNETISGIQKAYITRDCLSGLSHLQKNFQRNHGDISSNNIVFSTNSKTAKLNDFDLSKKFKQNEKKQFDEAKIKDTEKLNEAVYKNQHNDKQSKKVNSILEKNKGQHENAQKEIEQEVILEEYKKQAQFQRYCHYGTTFVNTCNGVAHDIHRNGLTLNTGKIAVREAAKGGIGIAADCILEKVVKSKILQKPENYRYRGGYMNYGLMAGTEILKEGVDYILGYKQLSKQQLKRSAKRVVGNTASYVAKQQITKKLEQQFFGKAIQKITNFSSKSISQVGGKTSSLIIAGEKTFLSGLGSAAKANAISASVGCAIGIGIDYFCNDKYLKTAVYDNLKSSSMSFAGSCIGSGIGSVVPVIGTAAGGFVGGLIGGALSSWSDQISQGISSGCRTLLKKANQVLSNVSKMSSAISSFASSLFSW